MSAPSLIAKQMRIVGKAFLSWQRTRAEHWHLSVEKRRHALSALLALGALTLGGASFVLGISPTVALAGRLSHTAVEPVPLPDMTPVLRALHSTAGATPHNLFARNGETLTSLMARLGAADPQAVRFIRTRADLRPIVMPQAGQYISAGVLDDGRLAYLRLYLEGPHRHDSRVIEVSRRGHELIASSDPFPFDIIEESASGAFDGRLDRTAAAMGLPETVAEQLPYVWDGKVNPIRDLKKGDRLRVIYEKKYADGSFVRNGQILAVQVAHDGKTREAFWFTAQTPTGRHEHGNFYTLDGESARQTFMRVPLDIQDVSSEFAPLRRHPITGKLRAHNGTDFRAPSGSRIFAAADGTVSFVGYERKGYGRYVKITHGLGRETVYAHMSRITRGLHRGQQVKKGDIIGYVGMTGLATGPHLHYELKFDGVQINPLTTALPDTQTLSAFQLARLKSRAEPLQLRFKSIARHESAGDGDARSLTPSRLTPPEGFADSFPKRSRLVLSRQ